MCPPLIAAIPAVAGAVGSAASAAGAAITGMSAGTAAMLSAGTSAASAGLKFIGDSQATSAYNANALAAQNEARLATVRKYGDLQTKYNYDMRATNQEGYKVALKAREEGASGVSSAGSAGIAGGSLTLDNLIAQTRQQAAQNEANVQAKRDDMTESLRAGVASTEAEGKQRISQTPLKVEPSILGLGINMASAGLSGYAAYKS